MQASALDQSLVNDCLHGDDEAWSRLLDRYKNLIYSIPVKLGFSAEDSAEIFQSVCVTLFEELPRLREPRALAGWLIQTTSHRCFRWKAENRRYVDSDGPPEMLRDESVKMPETVIHELNREQMVRDAIAELPSECIRLVELLFYRVPKPNYEDLAAELKIPKGSIGPNRIRCLEKIKRNLVKKGF